MVDFLTYAFIATIAGGVGGITGWFVNVFDLRKARLELRLLQEEVEKLNRTIRTDLSTDEIERYGRRLEEFTHRLNEPVRRVRNFPQISLLIAAAVTAGIFGGAMGIFSGGSGETREQLAAARSENRELTQRQRETSAIATDVAQYLEFELEQRRRLSEILRDEVLSTDSLQEEVRTKVERELALLNKISEENEQELTIRILQYLRSDVPAPERNKLIDALQMLQRPNRERP